MASLRVVETDVFLHQGNGFAFAQYWFSNKCFCLQVREKRFQTSIVQAVDLARVAADEVEYRQLFLILFVRILEALVGVQYRADQGRLKLAKRRQLRCCTGLALPTSKETHP